MLSSTYLSIELVKIDIFSRKYHKVGVVFSQGGRMGYPVWYSDFLQRIVYPSRFLVPVMFAMVKCRFAMILTFNCEWPYTDNDLFLQTFHSNELDVTVFSLSFYALCILQIGKPYFAQF